MPQYLAEQIEGFQEPIYARLMPVPFENSHLQYCQYVEENKLYLQGLMWSILKRPSRSKPNSLILGVSKECMRLAGSVSPGATLMEMDIGQDGWDGHVASHVTARDP